MIVRVQSQNVDQDHGRGPAPDQQVGLDLCPDECFMIEVGTVGTLVLEDIVIIIIKGNLLHIVADQ